MRCQHCGRRFERGAPFCGECGMPRRNAVGAVTASLTAILAALIAQVSMLCTWVTLALPFTDGETAYFSVYDVYRFIKNVGGVVGGIPMIEEWVIGATVCVLLMQLAVTALLVSGVLSLRITSGAIYPVGIIGALCTAGTSFGFIYMVNSILDHIKTTVVVQAVELTPAAVVAAAAALTATAALFVRRALCNKCK